MACLIRGQMMSVTSPKKQDPLIGHSLYGRYRIQRLLGEGQMARVYLAHQTAMGREVAVKVLRTELADDDDAGGRFRREIEAMARLSSPHTIQCFDCGETPSGYQFIVMEYLQGETLRQRLERCGLLTPAETLHIVAQIASALGEAHAAGIVHRDLKPANIHFCSHASPLSPLVKVLDFGLSSLQDAKRSPVGITDKHRTVGTPAYLAPEAAMAGRVCDWRSDIYALAVMCFEMLTGSRPFDGRNSVEVMVAHVREPIPSARELRSELPPAVDDFFTAALAKEPQLRLASAAALTVALTQALS